MEKERTMRVLRIGWLVVGLLMLWPALALAACTSHTVTGGYWFTLTGVNQRGNSFTTFGTLSFDGFSHVAVSETLNERGFAAQVRSSEGTYTVSANCIGTVTMASGSTYSGAVLYNGLAILISSVGNIAEQSSGTALRP